MSVKSCTCLRCHREHGERRAEPYHLSQFC
jgi:hypothetical protein